MHQLPPINNDEIFESFICDLFNEIYDTKSFNIYGKQGQNQKGIDIYSKEKKIVIQCKKKDITRGKQILKTELSNNILEDLNSVTSKDLKIEFNDFIFVSTFSNSVDLIELCSEIKKEKQLDFTVDYWGWENLSSKALKYQNILKTYFNDFVIVSSNTHQNIEDIKMKKQMEIDFAMWNNYKLENRKRRSRMIIKKFDSNYYPENPFDPSINNYTWSGAEFYKIFHDGVEFFIGSEIIFVDEDNNWNFNQMNESDRIVSVSKMGRIAFQDIMEYDMKGDEHYLCPIFLCNFRHNGTPYFRTYLRDIKNTFNIYKI